MGYHIATKLVQEKADVILIDLNSQKLQEVTDDLDVQTIQGYGANPEILLAAGLREADLLVAVSGQDETNLLACRIAQLLGPDTLRRVARVRASAYHEFLLDDKKFRQSFGVDYLINPSREAVETIMDFIDLPGASDVISLAKGRLSLVGMRLKNGHHLLGKPLKELLPSLKGSSGILVAAVYRNINLVIPNGDTVLHEGDLVYVAAGVEQRESVCNFFGLAQEPIRTITVVGGGEVGFQLAKRLENDERKFKVKLIEQKASRADYLSMRLKKTMVIRGDGTDQDLLDEENINDSDAFIAVSTDDEKNLIACLVAKRLGIDHTITRVNRSDYAPLVHAIGLEAMISARIAAVSAVLKYIRKGRVVSVATLAGEDAEIIELAILSRSRIAGKKLMEIKFPPHSLVIAITRGEELIIPNGQTVFAENDVLAIVARAEALDSLTRLLGGR